MAKGTIRLIRGIPFPGEIRTHLEIGKNGLSQTIGLRRGEQDIPAAAGGDVFEQLGMGSQKYELVKLD